MPMGVPNAITIDLETKIKKKIPKVSKNKQVTPTRISIRMMFRIRPSLLRKPAHSL